jgi:RimJ/RimL family protein N-acetyltransferase
MLVSGPYLRAYFEGNVAPIPEDAQFIGKLGDNGLVGVVAVWNFHGRDIEMGWAGEPGWLSRSFIRLVLRYVFEQLGCTRITGRIDVSNDVALEQSQRLGFVVEGRMREAGDDGDVLIVGLLKRECRWI